MLRIVVVGGGLIGPRHAQSVLSNPNTTLLAIVDPAPHGASLAASLHTAHYTSIASLLSSDILPDAAIICTPNHTHVPLALELLAAGIPVLIEKPISTSIASGKRLLAAASVANVPLLVGHHRRFNPYLISAKAVLASGSLGRIIAVQGIWALRKPVSYFGPPTEWRREAGVVLINLVHEIDLLQYLLGPIVLVHALSAINTRGFQAEEGAAILLRFEGGVVGTFLLSDAVVSPWTFEQGTGENPMIPQVGEKEGAGGFYRVLGTEGSLSVSDMTRWSYEGLRDGEEKGWLQVLNKERLRVEKENIPFDLQVQHLVDVVLHGAVISCSGKDGLSAMVVCDAVKKAMATGKPIRIDGLDILEEESRRSKL